MIPKGNVTSLRKIHATIKSTKAKYLTADILSRAIGLLPEKISEICAHFDPLAMIDYTFDLKPLLPAIEAYLAELDKEKPVRKRNITKKELSPYQSVVEFIYEKMTFGGIVDKSVVLSDVDLRTIRRLATDELKNRHPKTKKR